MNVVPLQERQWVYRNSNKDMHNSISVALGKLEFRRVDCYLLLKCYYQYWVSFFFISNIMISSPFPYVSRLVPFDVVSRV
jgi:hypothetical protein